MKAAFSTNDAKLSPMVRNPISTGVGGLDEILFGGLQPNRLYLIEGSPGTGKTTFSLQFLLAGLERHERCLYVTLSETREELFEVAESHGWNIEGLDLYEMKEAHADFRTEDQYSVLPPDEVELTETTQQVFELVEKIQPDRIVFDSASELRLLARDPLRYRRQILAFKHFFAGRKSTVFLLDDLTGPENDRQLQSIAHGVIRLDRLGKEYGVSRRFLSIIKLRGAHFRDGVHDYSIRRGGIVVFPRLVAAEYRNEIDRKILPSGVAQLDALVGGGLDMGASALILGPVGAGKSTIATQYVNNALRLDIKAVCYLFEESRERFLHRAAGIGIDLKPFERDGRLLFRPIDPAEISPGEFTSHLRHAVEEAGVQVVLIDSLTGYLNAMPNERFLIVQMHEILSYLNNRGVLTLLTLPQHGFVGQMTSPVDLSYMTDTIMLLRYFESAGQVKQALSVIKRREGIHERTIREFTITSEGIRMGQPLHEFSGVLTGVPVFSGTRGRLMAEQANAEQLNVGKAGGR
jgi:circadian clock protein KaiC